MFTIIHYFAVGMLDAFAAAMLPLIALRL